MDLKPVKRKKCSAPSNFEYFPSSSRKCFVAFFTGSSCYIRDGEDMADLFQMGLYGKGSLSKSEPNFNTCLDDLPPVLLEQQWKNRKEHSNNCCCNYEEEVTSVKEKRKKLFSSETISNFITRVQQKSDGSWQDLKSAPKTVDNYIPEWTLKVTDDGSDDKKGEIHTFVENILEMGKPRQALEITSRHDEVIIAGGEKGPRFESGLPAPRETLHLSLQESFFLAGALGKLTVLDQKGNSMTPSEMWTVFRAAETKFIERYIVYHWYRSRGWIVRDGVKYGGDFLLYEKAPSFCHSSYLVRLHEKGDQLTWDDLARLQRLVETFKKDIIFCYVVSPGDLNEKNLLTPDVVGQYHVREIMCRRFITSQQRESK